MGYRDQMNWIQKREILLDGWVGNSMKNALSKGKGLH